MAVRIFRLKEKIPGVLNEDKKPWTEEEERLLGTCLDEDLAQILGRTLTAVIARRNIRKIPPLDPKWRAWTSEEDALLGTDEDQKIARRLGAPSYTG